ncbi:MAG: hypothetical protein CL394_01830 [Acidiferrobacteraceae bacterium]|nr:hypothetical protein [Acidiferrobacteraceae bacterium]
MGRMNSEPNTLVTDQRKLSISPRYQYVTCSSALCVGCQLCEFACAMFKDETMNVLQSRIRLVRVEPVQMKSIACQSCADPACLKICHLPGAMFINAENGLVAIDEDICDGCTHCLDACPFGVIALDPDTKLAKICDLCADRAEGPACVEICPKDALEVLTPEVIAQRSRKNALHQLLAEWGTTESESICATVE